MSKKYNKSDDKPSSSRNIRMIKKVKRIPRNYAKAILLTREIMNEMREEERFWNKFKLSSPFYVKTFFYRCCVVCT